MKLIAVSTAVLLTAVAGLAIARPIDSRPDADALPPVEQAKPAEQAPAPAQEAADQAADQAADAPAAEAPQDQADQADQAEQAPAKPAAKTTAYLGVVVHPLGQRTAQDLGLKPGTGLRLMTVAPDSAALDAGLKAGDVLTKFNDQKLVHPQQLGELVRAMKPGDTVILHVLRGGEPIEIEALLGERPEPPAGPEGIGRIHRLQLGEPLIIPLDPFGDIDRADMPAGPEEINEMFEQMRARMQHRHEEMQQRIDQMRRQMKLDQDAPQPGVQLPGERVAVCSNVMINDGEHMLQLKTDGDSRRLTVKTAQGELLFEGQVPEDGKIEGLPKAVQDKVDGLLNRNRIELRFNEPAPKRPAEPKGPVA